MMINKKYREKTQKLSNSLKALVGIRTAKITNTLTLVNNRRLRLWWKYLQQKYQIDNTNKTIVSQDFGGNQYSKNSMIMFIINDKF